MAFGPAVVGEEKYEEERKERESPASKFGPRVVGESHGPPETDEPAPEPTTEAPTDDWPAGYEWERHGAYYAVTAPDGTPVESDNPSGKWQGIENAQQAAWAHASEVEAGRSDEPEPADDQPGEYSASADEVAEALAENPALVDRFLRTEIQRPDGVRARVLDALEQAEQNREQDARPEVLETIESLRPGV